MLKNRSILNLPSPKQVTVAVPQPVQERPCDNEGCSNKRQKSYRYCRKCLPIARRRAASIARQDSSNIYIAPRICEILDRRVLTNPHDFSPVASYDSYDEESGP